MIPDFHMQQLYSSLCMGFDEFEDFSYPPLSKWVTFLMVHDPTFCYEIIVLTSLRIDGLLWNEFEFCTYYDCFSKWFVQQ